MLKLGAFLLVFAAGCATSNLGRFSALSTAALPLPHALIAEHVEGRDCVVDYNVVYDWLFSPIAPPGDPSVQRALESALASAPGSDALVNVEVDRRVTWAGYGLWGSDCAIVRGDAVRVGPSEGAQR